MRNDWLLTKNMKHITHLTGLFLLIAKNNIKTIFIDKERICGVKYNLVGKNMMNKYHEIT